MKACKQCGMKKSLKEFNSEKRNKDGHTGKCTQCISEASKVWYKANRESVIQRVKKNTEAKPLEDRREYIRVYMNNKRAEQRTIKAKELEKWEKEHPEEVAKIAQAKLDNIKKAKRDYYLRNKELVASRAREYGVSEKGKATRVAYTKANQEKINAYKAEWTRKYLLTPQGRASSAAKTNKRRAAIRETDDGTVTTEALNLLAAEQNHKCYHCGEELDYETQNKVHLDHLVPLARGGQHTISNVRWSCRYCNLSKGAKLS